MALLTEIHTFSDRQRERAAQAVVRDEMAKGDLLPSIALLVNAALKNQLESERVVHFYHATEQELGRYGSGKSIDKNWHLQMADYKPVTTVTAYSTAIAETLQKVQTSGDVLRLEREIAKDSGAYQVDTAEMPNREAQVAFRYATHFILDHLYPLTLPEAQAEQAQKNQQIQNEVLEQLDQLPLSLEDIKANSWEKSLSIPISDGYQLTIGFVPQSTLRRTKKSGYLQKNWVHNQAFLRFSVNFTKNNDENGDRLPNLRRQVVEKSLSQEYFKEVVKDAATYIDGVDITKVFSIKEYRPTNTWVRHNLSGWSVNTENASDATTQISELVKKRTVRRLSELDATDFSTLIGDSPLPVGIPLTDILLLGTTFIAVVTDNPLRTEPLEKPESCSLFIAPVGNMRKEVVTEYDQALNQTADQLAAKLLSQATSDRPYKDREQVSSWDYERLETYKPTMPGERIIRKAREMIAEK